METTKLNDVVPEAGSLNETGTEPVKKKKTVSKKTSLQREKEERNEKRQELSKMLNESLREGKRLIREGGEMEAGDITGMQLEHRKFGIGEVISSNGRFFTVRFPSKEMKMQFPGAFDKGILTVPEGKDGELIEQICAQFREVDEKAAESDEKAREIGLKIAELGL